MSDNKIFEIGLIEFPETSLYYRPVKIDVSNYPELEGKTDEEIIQYLKDNAGEMAPTDDFYDSLEDELRDQDVIREKIPYVGSEIWAEVAKEGDDSEDEDSDDEDYDDED